MDTEKLEVQFSSQQGEGRWPKKKKESDPYLRLNGVRRVNGVGMRRCWGKI